MMSNKSSAGGVAVMASTLFLLALFSMPSYAAVNWLPYPPTIGRENWTLPACYDEPVCPGMTYCIDSNTLGVYEVYVLNETGNVTTTERSENFWCNDGCSFTLGDCRTNAFWQGIEVILLTLFVAVMIYIGPRFGPLGVALGIAALLLVMYVVAAWDVFSAGYQTIMLTALPIATVIYLAFHFYAAKPQDVPSSDMGDAE